MVGKRLERLLERDGAFHELDWDGTLVTPISRDEKKPLERVGTINEFDYSDRLGDYFMETNHLGIDRKKIMPIFSFSKNNGGYTITTQNKYWERARELLKEVDGIEDGQFKASGKKLNRTLKKIGNLTSALGVEDLGKLRDISSYFSRFPEKEMLIKKHSSRTYLFDDGTAILFGDKENLPNLKWVKKIDGNNAHDVIEFGTKRGFCAPEDDIDYYHKYPLFQIIQDRVNRDPFALRGVEEYVKDMGSVCIDSKTTFFEMWKNEYDSVQYYTTGGYPWDIDFMRRCGRKILENDSESYCRVIDFNRIYATYDNISVDISPEFETSRGRKRVKRLEENLIKSANRLIQKEDSYNAEKLFFNPNARHYFSNGWKSQMNVESEANKTSAAPNIETVHGDIDIVSRSPYVKINGADYEHGDTPPENPKCIINCHSIHGKIDVEYDMSTRSPPMNIDI